MLFAYLLYICNGVRQPLRIDDTALSKIEIDAIRSIGKEKNLYIYRSFCDVYLNDRNNTLLPNFCFLHHTFIVSFT